MASNQSKHVQISLIKTLDNYNARLIFKTQSSFKITTRSTEISIQSIKNSLEKLTYANC